MNVTLGNGKAVHAGAEAEINATGGVRVSVERTPVEPTETVRADTLVRADRVYLPGYGAAYVVTDVQPDPATGSQIIVTVDAPATMARRHHMARIMPVVRVSVERTPVDVREDYDTYARWAVGPVMTREEYAAKGEAIRAQQAAGTLSTNPYEWGKDMDAVRDGLHVVDAASDAMTETSADDAPYGPWGALLTDPETVERATYHDDGGSLRTGRTAADGYDFPVTATRKPFIHYGVSRILCGADPEFTGACVGTDTPCPAACPCGCKMGEFKCVCENSTDDVKRVTCGECKGLLSRPVDSK